jgi:hypothetical protein
MRHPDWLPFKKLSLNLEGGDGIRVLDLWVSCACVAQEYSLKLKPAARYWRGFVLVEIAQPLTPLPSLCGAVSAFIALRYPLDVLPNTPFDVRRQPILQSPHAFKT